MAITVPAFSLDSCSTKSTSHHLAVSFACEDLGRYPERRRVFFSRRGSQLSAFDWLLPRMGTLRPRLMREDPSSESRAMLLNAKRPYQLRITLESNHALKEAIELQGQHGRPEDLTGPAARSRPASQEQARFPRTAPG